MPGWNELSDISLWAGFGSLMRSGKYLVLPSDGPLTPAIGCLQYPPLLFAIYASLFSWLGESLRTVTAFWMLMNVLKLGLLYALSRLVLSRPMALLCVLFCAPLVFRHTSFGTDILAAFVYLAALYALLRGADRPEGWGRRAAAAGALLGLMFSCKQNLALASCVIVAVFLAFLPALRAMPGRLWVERAILILAALYAVVVVRRYPLAQQAVYGGPALAALAWIWFHLRGARGAVPAIPLAPFGHFAGAVAAVAGGMFLYWSRDVGAWPYFYGLFLMGHEFLFDVWSMASYLGFTRANAILLALLAAYGGVVWSIGRPLEEKRRSVVVRGASLAVAIAVGAAQWKYLAGREFLGDAGDLISILPFALTMVFLLTPALRAELRANPRVFGLFVATAFLYVQLFPGFDEIHLRMMVFPAVVLTFWWCANAVRNGPSWKRALPVVPLVAYMLAFHAWELVKIRPMLQKNESEWGYLAFDRARVWLPRPWADDVREAVRAVEVRTPPGETFYETGLLLRFLIDRPFASAYNLNEVGELSRLLPAAAQGVVMRELEAARPKAVLTNERDWTPGGRWSPQGMSPLKDHLDARYAPAESHGPFIILRRTEAP